MTKIDAKESESLESLLFSLYRKPSLIIHSEDLLDMFRINEKKISVNEALSSAEGELDKGLIYSLPPLFKENFPYKEHIKKFNYSPEEINPWKKKSYKLVLPEENHVDHAAFVALQEYLPELHEYLPNLFPKVDSFFKIKREHTFTRTEYLELSTQFAERIAEMEKQVLPAELNAVLGMLRAGPLLSALYQLGGILTDKAKQVSPKAREQVERLIQVYHHATSEETAIGQLMSNKVPFHGRIAIFDPATQNANRLNQMLASGGACTAQSYAHENRPADAFAEDAKVGGSVHFLYSQVSSSSSSSQSAYSRLYLAVDHESKPVVFYDCLESGNLYRCNINGYLQSGLQSHFLASFAASLVIANRLGIDKVAFGDLELVEAARDLGFGERKIFSEGQDQVDQKLGYCGAKSHDCTGPYMWMMKGSRNFRTLDPSLFQPESLILLVNQAQQVMSRISTDRKSVKRLRTDYETFFGMVREVYEVTRSATGETADQLVGQVDGFCKEYGLNISPVIDRKEVSTPEQPSIQTASSFY